MNLHAERTKQSNDARDSGKVEFGAQRLAKHGRVRTEHTKRAPLGDGKYKKRRREADNAGVCNVYDCTIGRDDEIVQHGAAARGAARELEFDRDAVGAQINRVQ